MPAAPQRGGGVSRKERKTGREESGKEESQISVRAVFASLCITLHFCFLLPRGPLTPVSPVQGQLDTLCVGLQASLEQLPTCQAHEVRGGVTQGACPALTKETRLESPNSAQGL